MTAPDQLVRYSRYRYANLTLDQWRDRGQAALGNQRMRVASNINYFDGQFPLLFIPGENRDIFRRLLRESVTNWCELVVNAVAERLLVFGFDFADARVNALAWLIWQDNQMDADSEMAQTDSLVCGNSIIGVWPSEERSSGVKIEIEHASQVVLFYNPGTRRDPIAMFKSFGVESTQTDVLVTADRVQTWTGDAESGSTAEINELGQVPYVEMTPAPSTIGAPRSELHSARPIQDRINTTIYNRLVASDFGAFRQITATGVTLDKRPDGSYKAPFNVGADRLLISENPEASFGAITESNLSGYLNAVQADVMHLAAITQTPPHYLLGQIVNASGDALKAAEAGLVSKVRRRAAHIGEAWEQVMRLALGYLGEAATANVSAEVIWRDFETRSETELIDALVKAKSLGVPTEYLWRRWGVSPQVAATWPTPPEPSTDETQSSVPAPTDEGAAA